MMRILVTGATGFVGRNVLPQLVSAGAEVRALTRDPAKAKVPAGVELFRGDLGEPNSLTEALIGVERMYLFPAPETAREIVARAVKAGVRRIVVLSSGAVTTGYDTEFHLPVEQAVEESGLEWTHVRPGEFATNTVHMWAPSIRVENAVYDPYPDAVGVPTHERDVADIAALALLEDGHTGKAYTIVGPETLTHAEQVDAIAAAVGRELSFKDVSVQDALAYYQALGGWAAANAPFLLGLVTYSNEETTAEAAQEYDKAAVEQHPTAENVTNRPGRTFAQWARDHADDFR
jgi:uncharacterized protein YbjT (DUF2867 family)